MALHQTTLPTRPAKKSDVGQQVWTVWEMLLFFINSVYDTFANKFASGLAVVATGATTAVVTHGLETLNYAASITPNGDPGGRIWISGKTSTQFTINLQVAAGGAGQAVDWMVQAL